MAEGGQETGSTQRFLSPPAYTQFPNELLDEILPIAGLAEWKVISAIARQTFGFKHTPERLLSNTRLRELTGLSRQAVTDGLKAGEDRGYIAKRNAGGNSWRYGVRVGAVREPCSQPPERNPGSQDVDILPTRKFSIPEKENPTGSKEPGTGQAGADQKADSRAKKPGAKFTPDPTVPLDAVITELYELWLNGTEQPSGTVLTNKRAGQVRSRLREQAEGAPDGVDKLAHAATAMREAMAGWLGSDWHRRNQAYDWETLFRSRTKVDMFRGRFHKQGPTQPSGKYAEYDALMERPTAADEEGGTDGS